MSRLAVALSLSTSTTLLAGLVIWLGPQTSSELFGALADWAGYLVGPGVAIALLVGISIHSDAIAPVAVVLNIGILGILFYGLISWMHRIGTIPSTTRQKE